MHIFAGAPAPIVLDEEHPPQWKDRILLLNPTSIYWRYYAITLRVVRAEKYGAGELAPANAIFWVGEERGKWNGSEDMVEATKDLLNQTTADKKFKFGLSVSTFTTFVIALQGVQALYELFNGFRLGRYALAVSLPNIFQPLAIAGLFRLLCSPWLRDDYYADLDDQQKPAIVRTLPESGNDSPPAQRTNLLRRQRCLAVAAKVFFLSTTAALLAMASWYFNPNPRVTAGTASTLLINVLYAVFLLATLIIAVVYTARGRTGTTIIPCINKVWYRIYTYMLFGLAGVVMVITALETRRTACGEFTTYPVKLKFDKDICSKVSLAGRSGV